MAQAYNVFLSETDQDILDFEKTSDIQPLTSSTAMSEDRSNRAIASGEAEALSASAGIFFNLDDYISTNFSDKKGVSNARAVLSYLHSNVDPSVLKFSQDGRIFYQGASVPGANLKKVLESLTCKRQKVLQVGEYFLLSNLTHAPDYIKSLVHSHKLKMFNIQFEFSKQPQMKRVPPLRPANVQNPPSTVSSLAKPVVEVKSASPFTYYPYQQKQPQLITRTSTKLDKTVRGPSANQKRFNVKEQPWYKLK